MKPTTSVRIAAVALGVSTLAAGAQPHIRTAAPEVAVDDAVIVRAYRPNNHPLHPCGVPFPGPPSPRVERAIRAAAAEFGVNPQLMLDIAAGETGFTVEGKGAINRYSDARGLFQHRKRYWKARVRAFNRKHPESKVSAYIFNLESQSRITAFMLAGHMGKSGKRAWRC